MSPKPRGRLECLAFSETSLLSLINSCSGQQPSAKPRSQALYLARHLADLGAKSIILEHHYIDRHYMEEFALYYSKCLYAYPNHCARLHFFSTVVTEDTLRDQIQNVSREDETKDAFDEISEGYLGYIVVRPIPSVPIGRTVLRPPAGSGSQFDTLRGYEVHLAGLRLRVTGLAFQQQDRGVSACATTAIWSALQRVARTDGARAPTPSELTEHATRYVIPGRAYPQADGLTLFQMCEAIRSADYAPQVISAEDPDALLLSTHLGVDSGIPCILLVASQRARHAVTAVGFEISRSAPDVRFKAGTIDLAVASAGMETIFIHDDRLGPYARATLLRQPPNWDKKHQFGLTLQITHMNGVEEVGLTHCLAPMYPKIRVAPIDIYGHSALFADFIQSLLPSSAHSQVTMRADLSRAGDYARRVLRYGMTAERTLSFLGQSPLSRYVGVLRFELAGQPFFETIWDTTDTARSARHEDALLGAICFIPQIRTTLESYVQQYGPLVL